SPGTSVPARTAEPPAPVPERTAEPAATAPEPDREPAAAAERPVVEETVVPTETLLPSDEDAFDHLWGSTVLRPVEQAAVRADEPEDDVDLAPPPPRP